MKTLNHSVSILFPTHWGKAIELIKLKFAANFGGYTSTKHIGGYRNNNGVLIEEHITEVKSYSETIPDKGAIRKLAAGLGYIHGEESVAVIIDNVMYIIELSGAVIDRNFYLSLEKEMNVTEDTTTPYHFLNQTDVPDFTKTDIPL